MSGATADHATKVADIVCRIGNIAPIASHADIFDSGFQSIHALDLLLELEAAFDVSIPDSDFVNCRSVRDLAGLIERLTAGSGA